MGLTCSCPFVDARDSLAVYLVGVVAGASYIQDGGLYVYNPVWLGEDDPLLYSWAAYKNGYPHTLVEGIAMVSSLPGIGLEAPAPLGCHCEVWGITLLQVLDGAIPDPKMGHCYHGVGVFRVLRGR